MKITDYVSNTIDRLPKGYVFTYKDFLSEVSQREAVIKALNRMVAAGKISKLSKGKYYKPETTPFGPLLPDQRQIVKDLLEENGKVTGYMTGYSIYNKLGLTTQVSNTIQIGKNEIRSSFKRDRYVISFIRQKNIITKSNIPFLQVLDSIRFIKNIPDTTIETSCKRLLVILSNIQVNDGQTLSRLAIKYPPATRALLGALFDQLEIGDTKPLLNSLNPITVYQLTGASKVLSFTEKWNIK